MSMRPVIDIDGFARQDFCGMLVNEDDVYDEHLVTQHSILKFEA